MKEVYIVHRHVSYKYPDNEIEEIANTVSKVFDTEDKAVDYIRKEIADWRDTLVRRKRIVEPIVDETQWSRPGMRAYFRGRDGDASVFRNMYYEVHDVE
jgi:hypothetical protein